MTSSSARKTGLQSDEPHIGGDVMDEACLGIRVTNERTRDLGILGVVAQSVGQQKAVPQVLPETWYRRAQKVGIEATSKLQSFGVYCALICGQFLP